MWHSIPNAASLKPLYRSLHFRHGLPQANQTHEHGVITSVKFSPQRRMYSGGQLGNEELGKYIALTSSDRGF